MQLTPRPEQRLWQVPAIIGTSEQAVRMRGFAEMAARTDHTVLLLGETGVGKDQLAEAIHFMGHSNQGTFVPVNCGAMPEMLLESELFGHVRGAYTDARDTKPGLVQAAEGGTLFLNEVTNMSLSLQAKFLRVLEKKTFRAVGGTRETLVNTRIVAATNANLERAIQQGSLRSDFYYRLSVITFTVPPLRDRSGDIPELAEHFLWQQEEQAPKNFSPETMAILMGYHWPGNIRELKNAVVRATFHCTAGGESEIRPRHIDPHLLSVGGDKELPTLHELERDYFRKVLRKTSGHVVRAAEVAGVDRKTIYNKIRKFQLQDLVETLKES